MRTTEAKISLEKRYITRSKKRVILEFEDDMFIHGTIKRAVEGKDKQVIWFKDGRMVGRPADHPLCIIEDKNLIIPESFHIVKLGFIKENIFEIDTSFDYYQIGSGQSLTEAFKSALSKIENKWNINHIRDDLSKWLEENYEAETLDHFKLRQESQMIEDLDKYSYKVIVYLNEKIQITDIMDIEKITD